MGLKRTKKTSGAPQVTLRQMKFDRLTLSRDGRHGRLGGELGSYHWSLSFSYEDDPFDSDLWLWDFHFSVRLNDEQVYGNTRSLSNVAKTIFGEPYLRQLAEALVQEFIDEGPAS